MVSCVSMSGSMGRTGRKDAFDRLRLKWLFFLIYVEKPSCNEHKSVYLRDFVLYFELLEFFDLLPCSIWLSLRQEGSNQLHSVF